MSTAYDYIWLLYTSVYFSFCCSSSFQVFAVSFYYLHCYQTSKKPWEMYTLSLFPSLSLLDRSHTFWAFTFTLITFFTLLSLFFLFLIQSCIIVPSTTKLHHKKTNKTKKQHLHPYTTPPPHPPKQPKIQTHWNKTCFALIAFLTNAWSLFSLFSVCFVLCKKTEFLVLGIGQAFLVYL